jgi:type II secretory pathway component PulK
MSVNATMSSRQPCRLLPARFSFGERGVVLILAILAVALLTTLAVAIIGAVRVELLASRSTLERMQGLFLAEAGLQQARAILVYDDQTVDSLEDPWGPLCQDPLDWPRDTDVGTYRVRVYDLCGRIDVNRANYRTLTQLIGDPAIAAAILDWRDPNDVPRPLGAEQEYYLSLPVPYLPRNGHFQTLGELLLVKGVTPDLFFGSAEQPGLADLLTVESLSLNTDANGEPRLGLNEFRNWSEPAFQEYAWKKLGGILSMYDLTQIWHGMTTLPGYRYVSLGQLATAAGLSHEVIVKAVDVLTVDSRLLVLNRLNVNTASPEVLAALPGSGPQLADAIVTARQAQPFVSLNEVADILLAQPDGTFVFAQLIDRLTTKSSSFVIEAMGAAPSGRFRTLYALVRRVGGQAAIVQQSEQDWPLPPLLDSTEVVSARRSLFGLS